MSEQEQEQMSDEEALMKLAQAMGKNVPTEEEKQSLFSFLRSVITEENNIKIGNLVVTKEYDEIGIPQHSVRACLEMKRIADKIMNNKYLENYFDLKAQETLASGLSREGFLIRQSSTQTKQVADVTKKRVVNKKLFGREQVQETGGDTFRQV